MSGLFANLNSAVVALNAHSRSIEIAGKNLANVSNPSYARQRVLYGDRGTVVTPQGAYSMGLEAMGVQQLRDHLLDRQVSREGSLTAYYQAQQNAYQRAQAALGQNISSAGKAVSTNSTADDTGISAALDDFFNAFQSLASHPTDTGIRQSMLEKTTILTDRVSLADTRLEQVQNDLFAQVDSDVTETNRLLETISDLNNQIARFEVSRPGSAVDLRDQRQAAIEKLTAKLPIETTELGTGQVVISARDGLGAPVVLVDATSVTGPVTFAEGPPPTVTGGAAATVLDLSSGAIQGSIDAHGGAVQTLRDQLAALAQQLVTSVNAIYNPTDTAGMYFFEDVATVTPANFRLASTVTVSNLRATIAGQAGDNDVALDLAALATKKFTGVAPDVIVGTFGSYYSSAVSGLGQAVSGATARVNDQTRIEQLVRSQRDAVSGVSLDEELADLMKYQRAFQASSRVFQTIDNLLEVVVTQLGR